MIMEIWAEPGKFKWDQGSGGLAPFWNNRTLTLDQIDGWTSARQNFTVAIFAKHMGELPIGYQFFNIQIGNTVDGAEDLDIPASETEFKSDSEVIKLRSNALTLT